MFKFWNSGEQPAKSLPDEISADSWCPSTPSSSSSFNNRGRSHSPSYVFPPEAGEIVSSLRGKSVDELKKLLSDKDAYRQFLHSLDEIKTQSNLREELLRETAQLARNNLEKEPRMTELRNQCRIIRTTELAAAHERVLELEKRGGELLKVYSPSSLITRLEVDMKNTEEESESMHRQLLEDKMDVAAFVQKYKKLRSLYHRRALTHLAAKACMV